MDKQSDWLITPSWLKIVMICCKWVMVMIPFVVSSIAMFWESNMTLMNSGMWNCIFMLSLVKIIDMTDND